MKVCGGIGIGGVELATMYYLKRKIKVRKKRKYLDKYVMVLSKEFKDFQSNKKVISNEENNI